MLNRITRGALLALFAGALLATPAVHAQTTWYVVDDAPEERSALVADHATGEADQDWGQGGGARKVRDVPTGRGGGAA